jgi:hypothetical protein
MEVREEVQSLERRGKELSQMRKGITKLVWKLSANYWWS